MNKPRVRSLRGICALFMLFISGRVWIAGAQEAQLFFPGDSAFDGAFLDAISSGRVPETNTFPRFGRELSDSWPASLESDFFARFSTPTLYYDSPATQDDLAANLLAEPNVDVRAFPEIQHFLGALPDPVSLDFALFPGDSVAFRIDLFFNYRRDRISGQNSTFQWNLDEWLGNLIGAAEFPRKAYIAFSGESAGFALGRFPAGMGWGRFSGSILNPRALWYDQARFYIESEKIRFTSMLATSSAQLSNPESEIQFRRKEDGSSFWDSLNDHDFAGADQALKLATWHQFEWRPAPWIQLAFAEMGMVGGRTPSLAFVLPSVIWHSTYAAGIANVGASLSAAVVPLPGMLISGEFFIDDVRSTDEPTTSKPAAFAWNGTVQWTSRLDSGHLLHTGIEYQHVDRWTYVRWNPYLSMYQRQTLAGGRRSLDQSLGAPWGPDHDTVSVFANIKLDKGISLELAYEFIRKGPIYQGMAKKMSVTADFDGDPDTADTTQTIWVPVFYDYDTYAGSGALAEILARPDEYRHLVTLKGTVPVSQGIEFQIASTIGFYGNFGHVKNATETAVLVYAGMTVRLPSTEKGAD